MQQEQNSSEADVTTLVRSAQDGDAPAFGQLVLLFQDHVYNTCRRICGHPDDAADLTQETFVKAYRGLGGFQSKSSFYTWIFRIAVNLSLSHRRRANLRLVGSLDDEADASADGRGSFAQRIPDERAPQPDARAEAGELREQVESALQAIDREHRSVLVLREIEGLDYRRIAEVLDVAVGTVKSRVHRARTALRNELEKGTATRVMQSE